MGDLWGEDVKFNPMVRAADLRLAVLGLYFRFLVPPLMAPLFPLKGLYPVAYGIFSSRSSAFC